MTPPRQTTVGSDKPADTQLTAAQLRQVPPLQPTPPAWTSTVRADFATFLSDHASCEKKASGMALSVASHYPDRPVLLSAMVDLAVEELAHYRQVMKLLLARQLQPGGDVKDPYIHALNGAIRRGAETFLLDRLLVGAVVERRGAERFALLAEALAGSDPELARFYDDIAASEARHWELFVHLALRECVADSADEDTLWTRLAELAAFEGDVVTNLPLRAALH